MYKVSINVKIKISFEIFYICIKILSSMSENNNKKKSNPISQFRLML